MTNFVTHIRINMEDGTTIIEEYPNTGLVALDGIGYKKAKLYGVHSVEMWYAPDYHCTYIPQTDYKRSIYAFRFEGIPYRTFINDDADMVIRYNEFDNHYTDEIYDATGKFLSVIDFEDGKVIRISKGV